MWGRGSINGGVLWMAATLDPPTARAAWRFWSYTWVVPAPGRYAQVVRGTDGFGKIQTSIEQGPAPDGATGLHDISVTVA